MPLTEKRGISAMVPTASRANNAEALAAQINAGLACIPEQLRRNKSRKV